MLFELVDILQKKRRLVCVVLFIALDFWLLTFCSQALHAHRSDITARINSATSSAQAQYQGDIFAGDSISDSITHIVGIIEVGTLRTTVVVTDGFTNAERGAQSAAETTGHDASISAIAAVRAMGTVAITAGRMISQTIAFAVRMNIFPYVATGHGVGYIFGAVSGKAHSSFASVIQPQQDAKVPIITPEQAAQALSIQKDTVAVTPTKPAGSGGACDSGAGNGGYPMDWCNARMDTTQTSARSGPINRECTSYAFWYFTTIEGHANFYATGNANRWASTSNYPTHAMPVVGAIAVETTGVYGHVAIVQGLPGQTYEGETVPSGDVLVSEMNYDWQGHFRYSYSPLSKFSAYIY